MVRRVLAALFLAQLLTAAASVPLGAAGVSAPAVRSIPPSAGAARFEHIALVVMENRSQTEIIGNPAAPFVNGLAAGYAYLDSYSAVAHPSLPNYLALLAGDTFGVTSNCTTCFFTARTLADSLAEAGISGKAYMEDMPRACFAGSRGGYAQKHNPFAYFDSIRLDSRRCQAVVPYSDLPAELAGGPPPAFMWITPNMCHDMHDCGVAAGDRWLADNLPPLLNSAAFADQPSLLAIVWDEDDGSASNRVPLILAGPGVKRGYLSHTPANHYSLLRTIELAWGLPPLTANDAGALPVTDVFQA